jgi:hypothetical protein
MADRIQKLLSSFTDVSTDTLLAVGDNLSVTPRVLIANKTGWTLYVQKAAFNVTTDNAATQTLQSITTNEVIAATEASPGLGVIMFDFGADGYALPEGEGLELANSGAGLGAAIAVQAYYRRTATFSGNTAPPAPIVGAV